MRGAELRGTAYLGGLCPLGAPASRKKRGGRPFLVFSVSRRLGDEILLSQELLPQAGGIEAGGTVDLVGLSGAREFVHSEDAVRVVRGQQERIQKSPPAVV